VHSKFSDLLGYCSAEGTLKATGDIALQTTRCPAALGAGDDPIVTAQKCLVKRWSTNLAAPVPPGHEATGETHN
jgi:hypothetical protein